MRRKPALPSEQTKFPVCHPRPSASPPLGYVHLIYGVGSRWGRGNPWLALAAGRRCELARLGKLGDGSARRDVVAALVTGIEALAVGLAVAMIAIVEVDGHERLAVFSFAHVPALPDALRVTQASKSPAR